MSDETAAAPEQPTAAATTSGNTSRERAMHMKDRVREEYSRHAQENRTKKVVEVPNPFVYDGPLWTPRQIGLVLAGIIVIPIRVFLFSICTFLVWGFLKLSIMGEFDETKPMQGWRRWIQYPAAYVVRATMFMLGFYWVETVGTPCDSKDARIVVCAPHSTVFDTLYLVYAYRLPSAISKAENKNLPLAGTSFRAMQALGVDRTNRSQKDLAMDYLTKFAADETQRHLVIFPEGTCTNRKALITFKRGAFVPGQPVQPVCLEWPWTGFDLTWTAGGPSRLALAFHAACQPILKLKVTFLPVYYPTEEEKKDYNLYARNVRALMAETLKIPCTNHSYEDMFLAKEARKMGFSLQKHVPFELNELTTLFSISLADAKSLMKRYASIYKNSERVDGPGFAKILGIPYTRPVRELYELLRSEESATLDEAEGIDFKQLLIGIASLSKALNTSEMEESIGLIWDAVSDGQKEVTEGQVYERLSRVFDKFNRIQSKKMFSTFDAERKGKVTFEMFREYIKAQPELLFVSLGTIAQREKGRRLSVLDKTTGKSSNNTTTKTGTTTALATPPPVAAPSTE